MSLREAFEGENINPDTRLRAARGSGLVTFIARICHETNRAYCAARGDLTHKSWEETSPQLQMSAVQGVEHLIKDPTLTPEQMHENWKQYKIQQGWRYGIIKDEEKKTHPCIVPTYADLPEAERIKDHVFSAIVKTILEINGLMPPKENT